MPCEQYSEQLLDYILGDSDEQQAAGVESHLASCKACADEVRDLREIIRTLREADQAATTVGRDPHFKSRVIHKIPQRRRELVILRRKRTASKATFVAATVAAALFIVVIVYLLATDFHQKNATMDSMPEFAQMRPGEGPPGTARPSEETAGRPVQEVVESAQKRSEPSAEVDREDYAPDAGGELVVIEPAPEPVPDKLPPGPGGAESGQLVEEAGSEPATREAGAHSSKWVAQLRHVRGEVQLKRAGSDRWVRGAGQEKISVGDSIRTSRGGGGTISLTVGGAAVLNRSSTLTFNSWAEYELEKGEVLACSYRWPLTVRSGAVRVLAKRSDVCVRRKTRHTWVMALNGSVQVISGEHTASLAPGMAAVVAGEGKPEIIQNVDVGKEIDWVSDASEKFKVWLEGECCSVKEGYFVLQQTRRDLSNYRSLCKIGKSASLSWRMRLPYAMPCYIWVRYARREREPEKIGLTVNREKVGEKVISKASAKWFWIRAFKVTLKRRSALRLSLESRKPLNSRVDLILITNDPGFKPPREMPKGGFYGKR